MQLEIRHISISGKLLILIIVIFVILVAGLLSWFVYQKNFGWSTYKNTRYGYSLRYPSQWFFDSDNSEQDFVRGVGGRLTISNTKNGLAQLVSDNPPADLIIMGVSVYKVDASTTVSEFIRGKVILLVRANNSFVRYKIPVGGVQGEQIIYYELGTRSDITSVKTVFKKDNKMFVISCNYLNKNSSTSEKYKLPASVASVHDAILN